MSVKRTSFRSMFDFYCKPKTTMMTNVNYFSSPCRIDGIAFDSSKINASMRKFLLSERIKNKAKTIRNNRLYFYWKTNRNSRPLFRVFLKGIKKLLVCSENLRNARTVVGIFFNIGDGRD